MKWTIYVAWVVSTVAMIGSLLFSEYLKYPMDLMDNNMKPKDIWEKIARKIQTEFHS